MGVSTISTVLVPATASAPANPYDLTDLATVHDELQIPTTDTSKDAFLSRAITQASSAIAKHCSRVFPVEAVQDQLYIQQDPYPYQVPGGIYPLQLSRWPLQSSSVVSFTATTDGTTAVLTGVSSAVGLTVGTLVFGPGVPPGAEIQSIGTGTVTLTLPTTSANAAASFNTGVQVTQLLAVGMIQTLVAGTDFVIQPDNGWLIRLNTWTGVSEKWEAVPTTIQYQGGYTPIPYDLVDACLRLVTMRYYARGRDPMLVERTQPNLGTQRWWFGSQPGQDGALPPEIEGLLLNYRVPVAA